MIPIKRKSFINRYRNCVMCLYFLCGSSQSNSQRSIIVLLSIVYPYNVGLLPKSYGFFTYVSPHTRVVISEPIVVQSGLFVLRQTHWRNKSSVVSGSDLLPNPFYAFIKTYSLIISNNSSLELS